MTKSELREMIRECLREELSTNKRLQEALGGRAVVLIGDKRRARINGNLKDTVKNSVPEEYCTIVFDVHSFAREYDLGRFMDGVKFYADEAGLAQLKQTFEGTKIGDRLIADTALLTINFNEGLEEGAFSGGYAEGGNTIDRWARPGASTQPDHKSYLNRLKSKNPELVDIMTVKGKDIQPGMITQAGQAKEVKVGYNNYHGKDMVYIMHTNNWDGYWDVDADMEVLVDPDDKSKPFTGDYRALLKRGLKESLTEDNIFEGLY